MRDAAKLHQATTSGTTRREFLTATGASLLALTAAPLADLGALLRVAPAQAREFKGTKSVSVGIMAPSHCAAPYVYAGVKELYAKNGLKADVVLYQGMPDIAKDLIG